MLAETSIQLHCGQLLSLTRPAPHIPLKVFLRAPPPPKINLLCADPSVSEPVSHEHDLRHAVCLHHCQTFGQATEAQESPAVVAARPLVPPPPTAGLPSHPLTSAFRPHPLQVGAALNAEVMGCEGPTIIRPF